MKKKTKKVTFFVVIIILLITAGSLFFLGKQTTQNNAVDLNKVKKTVDSLSVQEAVARFDSTYVLYLLSKINVNALHKNPLTQNTPKIEIRLEDSIYSAEIKNSRIYVQNGEIEREDIAIITKKEEAVKMIKDENYAAESFQSGGSEVVLIANKIDLFATGYLKLDSSLTGAT